MDIEYPILLTVDIEEVRTSSTSLVKPKRRLQIEEIIDNSLALVPYESDEVDPIIFNIPVDSDQETEFELRAEVCIEREGMLAASLGEDRDGCNEEVPA